MNELRNFLLFLFAIAKLLLLTSVGVGVAIAVIAERCGLRVVAFGVEKSSGDGQLATALSNSATPYQLHWATSPSRKVRVA